MIYKMKYFIKINYFIVSILIIIVTNVCCDKNLNINNVKDGERNNTQRTRNFIENSISKTGYDEAIIKKKSDIKKDIKFGVLLPSTPPSRGGSRVAAAVRPAIDLAVKKIIEPGNLLEGFNITVHFRDTQCSSVYGPLGAFDLYTHVRPGCYQKTIFKNKKKTNKNYSNIITIQMCFLDQFVIMCLHQLADTLVFGIFRL